MISVPSLPTIKTQSPHRRESTGQVKAPVVAASGSTSPQGKGPRPPAKGMVEFEVREGDLAIAFGDVVLGKVKDMKEARGITETTRSRLWESGEIPFSIDRGIVNPQAIHGAIEVFHTQTSVRFVPFSGQKDVLVFVPAQALCASYLGKMGGGQPIYIAPDCGVNEVMHEIMHALGFVHEQSRTDRDKYLEILWTNIDPQFWLQFWIVPDDLIHDYVGSVFSFDAESIMLYSPDAFAKTPGTMTMRSRQGLELHPSRGTFSRVDRERLQYLYGR